MHRIRYSYAVNYGSHPLSLHEVGLSRSFCHIYDPFTASHARPGQSSSPKAHKNTFPNAPHTLFTRSRASFVFAGHRFVSQFLSYIRPILCVLCAPGPIILPQGIQRCLPKLHPLALFTRSRPRCASFVFAGHRFVSQFLSYTRSICRILCTSWPIFLHQDTQKHFPKCTAYTMARTFSRILYGDQ